MTDQAIELPFPEHTLAPAERVQLSVEAPYDLTVVGFTVNAEPSTLVERVRVDDLRISWTVKDADVGEDHVEGRSMIYPDELERFMDGMAIDDFDFMVRHFAPGVSRSAPKGSTITIHLRDRSSRARRVNIALRVAPAPGAQT